MARRETARAPSGLGRWRRVYTKLFTDPKFRCFTDRQKLVAVFCLAGPPTNRLGFSLLSPAAAAETLHFELEAFRADLVAVCRAFGWSYDENARVLLIPTWFRDNRPENPNVLEGALKDLAEVPQSYLFQCFVDATLANLPERWHDTFRKGIANVLETGAEPSGNVRRTSAKSVKGHRTQDAVKGRRTQDTGASEKAAPADLAFEAYADRWNHKFNYRPDPPNAAQMMELSDIAHEHGTDGLTRALDAYFASTDDFVLEARHPLALFLKQSNRWLAIADGPSPWASTSEVQ